MDFFAYYDGISIEAFSAHDMRAARSFINLRYKDAHLIVICPVGGDYKTAQAESVRRKKNEAKYG